MRRDDTTDIILGGKKKIKGIARRKSSLKIGWNRQGESSWGTG